MFGEAARQITPQKDNYLIKHFTRSVLLAWDDLVWHIDWASPPFDSMKMKQVLRWTPDENHECDPVANLTCKEVHRAFGLSPLWVSCWACFAGFLTASDEEALLRTPERQFLRPVESFEKALHNEFSMEDTFTPTMRDFLGVARGDVDAPADAPADASTEVAAEAIVAAAPEPRGRTAK